VFVDTEAYEVDGIMYTAELSLTNRYKRTI